MIAQKVSFSFFVRLLINLLGFVSLFFIARYMGPEVLGIISFSLAYVGLFQNFSDLGFGSAHIKRVSEGRDFGRCNGTYFTSKVLLSIAMAIIILSTIFVSKFIQHKSFISREHEIVLYVILLSTIVGNLSMMFNITFGARKETAKQSLPLLVGKIVEVLGKVIIAVLGLSVIYLAGMSLIGAVVILLCFVFLFRGYPIERPDREYFKSYAAFAIPVMFIGFLTTISHNLDKVMVQFFWSSTEVGYYSAAQRISFVLTFITVSSTTLIFPTISSYYAKNNIKSIRNLSNKAERYLSMIFFPVTAFIIVFSPQICRVILGPEFVSSANILIVLIIVALVNGITQPYTQQIGGTNRVILAAKLSAVIFAINVMLNLLFIPKELFGVRLLGMGGIGAAYATLISLSAGAVLFRVSAYRISASKPNSRVLLHLVSASIMGIILYIISKTFSPSTWYYLIAFAIFGIAVYILLLFILGEFRHNDLLLFLTIINPRKIKEYVSLELRSGYVSKS